MFQSKKIIKYTRLITYATSCGRKKMIISEKMNKNSDRSFDRISVIILKIEPGGGGGLH